MDGWDGRLSPSASLLRAPYGANKPTQFISVKDFQKNVQTTFTKQAQTMHQFTPPKDCL